MKSSTLTGDRRCSSARRSGMTVLGKVAVPKPINLPSQRLENHGLDPNVEIVPKGTLSWGNKSSSSISNPWGSLSQSPNTEGGTSSPSHLSGRPSSGGSGTRPSTAGSDRAHESTATTWGSNSRPSSASGVVTSNQTSLASLRPCSAETRPSSSPLSRFADSSSENPVAWSSAATAGKLGVVHHKDEGFALTSGDFPKLGSEKGNSGKNAESRDYEYTNRPASSSGEVTLSKESSATVETDNVSSNENVNISTVNSWRRDNPPYGEDGARFGPEKWQGHPQPYTGANMISPPYDSWNCVPANNPQVGVWYRGPLGGPPYGPPGAPGSFQMEPFPYYHPHIPPGPLANQQPGHPPGVGPRGHHPQSGDVYRHPIPDAFVRPTMPIRPGFYPGPVPYESYYGPPMGYVNERDAPFSGMLGGPSVYKRYPGQNAPDPNSQGRSSGYGSTGVALVSEKGDSGHSLDTQRPFKVHPNQHNSWHEEIVEKDGETSSKINQPRPNMVDQPIISSHTETVDQPRLSLQDNWVSGHGKDGKPDLRRRQLAEEASFGTSGHQGTRSSYSIKPKSHENVGNAEAVSDFSSKKLDPEAISLPEVRQAVPKDFTLIQKIEGLNAKARASDGWDVRTPNYTKQDEGNGFRVESVKTSHSPDEDCGPVYFERTHVDGVLNNAPNGMSLSSIDKSNEKGSVPISRRSTHEIQNRGNRERNNFSRNIDVLQKKSPNDSRGMVMATYSETSNAHVEHIGAVNEADSFPLERHEGEYVQPVFESNDGQVQRAKMRDLAKQRTKQLVEEEEERTRKQKAKAWAKLEELNRRTQAEAKPTQNCDNTPSDAIMDKQEESITFGAIRLTGNISKKFSSVISSPSIVAHKIEQNTTNDPESPILSTEIVKDGHEELVEPNQSELLKPDVNFTASARDDTVTRVHDGNTLKHKRTGYKHKQSIHSEESSTEKSTFTDEHKPQNLQTLASENSVVESSTHLRKKNNRSGKSKNKVEEGSLSAIAWSLSEEKKHISTSSMPVSDSETVSRDANHSSDQFALSVEDSQGKGNSKGKSQHLHRAPRNLQGRSRQKSHSNDAVIWAPVRSVEKSEVTHEGQAISSFLNADQVQNNSKNKRAEMERYVPKPVAKEMAQQESIQQPEVCSTNQTSDENRTHANCPGTENIRSTGSTTGNVGSASKPRIGDGVHYKPNKSHRLWQQRVDSELTSGQHLQDQSAKQMEPLQSQKVDESYYDEWNPPDGWNIPTSDSFANVTSRIARDQGNPSRGKQHENKGLRGLRNNFDLDQKKLNSVEDEKNYAPSARENRGVGERSASHWQPKSKTFPSNNHRGTNETADDSSSFQKDQDISEREAMTRKKISTHRGRPHSPKQGPVDLVDFVPASRGADTLQDLNSSGHDNKQRNLPTYRERSKHNIQYEYQPAGPNNGNKSNYSDGGKDNSASRYRESSRNNTRQGGGNSRQVHTGVDTSYE